MYLNKNQIAEAMGKSLTAINTWIRRGCPYIQKGGPGKEWKFDLAAVTRWRQQRDEGLNSFGDLSLERLQEQGYTGNGYRDLIALGTIHFFNYLINETGPAWSGLCKDSGLDEKFIRKLYVLTFMLFNHNLEKYIKHDILNNYFINGLGESLDELWASLIKRPVSKTGPADPDIPIPEIITNMLDEEMLQTIKDFKQEK